VQKAINLDYPELSQYNCGEGSNLNGHTSKTTAHLLLLSLACDFIRWSTIMSRTWLGKY